MCAMPTNEQPVSGPSRPPGIRSRRASRPRRDASPRRDRRQALIDAAIEMFTEDGSADISAAAVARRADVAHGLLFYYFTDKKGLVAAALVDMLDELGDTELLSKDEAHTRVRGPKRRLSVNGSKGSFGATSSSWTATEWRTSG